MGDCGLTGMVAMEFYLLVIICFRASAWLVTENSLALSGEGDGVAAWGGVHDGEAG